MLFYRYSCLLLSHYNANLINVLSWDFLYLNPWRNLYYLVQIDVSPSSISRNVKNVRHFLFYNRLNNWDIAFQRSQNILCFGLWSCIRSKKDSSFSNAYNWQKKTNATLHNILRNIIISNVNKNPALSYIHIKTKCWLYFFLIVLLPSS